MTDTTRRPGCIDDNMLAEYIDGGLDPRERADIEAHLADCGECYENFVDTVKVGAAVSEAGKLPAMTTGRRRHRGVRYMALGFAAAALIVVAVRPDRVWNRIAVENAISRLVAAQPTRFSVGRTTGAPTWAPYASGVRAGSRTESPAAALDAAETLRTMATGTTSLHWRGRGFASLAEGNLNGAVSAFESAVAADAASSDAAVDLAAALLERATRLGRSEADRTADLKRAVNESRRARQMNPASGSAVFNLALALELEGSTNDARAMWEAYLRMDSESSWAGEARDHLRRIR